jgi:hypothetical protein
MMPSRADFAGNASGAYDGLDVEQQRQLGAADADYCSAVLAPMHSGERDRTFTVDDAGEIGGLAG